MDWFLSTLFRKRADGFYSTAQKDERNCFSSRRSRYPVWIYIIEFTNMSIASRSQSRPAIPYFGIAGWSARLIRWESCREKRVFSNSKTPNYSGEGFSDMKALTAQLPAIVLFLFHGLSWAGNSPVEIRIVDKDTKEPVPCRLHVFNERGSRKGRRRDIPSSGTT